MDWQTKEHIDEKFNDVMDLMEELRDNQVLIMDKLGIINDVEAEVVEVDKDDEENSF